MNGLLEQLSDGEMTSLRESLEKLVDEFSFQGNYDSFFENPFSYMQRNDIPLLTDINKDFRLKNDFNNAVKKLRIPWRLMLKSSKCFICKLGVLILLYSLLGNVGLVWAAIIQVVDTLVGRLERWARKTGKKLELWLTGLKEKIESYTPEELAWQFCELEGACKPNLTS